MAIKKGRCNCVETMKLVRDTLNVIHGKWKLLIIISVTIGNNRFTAIQKSIPSITAKVLSKELKELEAHQLIKRSVIGNYPVKVLYASEPYIVISLIIVSLSFIS